MRRYGNVVDWCAHELGAEGNERWFARRQEQDKHLTNFPCTFALLPFTALSVPL
jgi:hypothetical protein